MVLVQALDELVLEVAAEVLGLQLLRTQHCMNYSGEFLAC